MVRSLELLSNKKERQKAFLRRKGALMKKAHELSVLCDVKVGMVIFSPEDCVDHQITKSEPLIWPENPQEIHCLVESYKRSGESVINNSRRNFDSSKVLNHQIHKAKNELEKLKHKNAESKRPGWDDRLNSLSSQELVQFAGVLENKIQEIRFRADVAKEYITYFSKQSSVTAMDASNDPLLLENQNMFESKSNDPLLLENQNMFESKSNVWQPMNPPDQYGVEVPFYNTFDGDLAAVVPTEVMANYGYGQDIHQALMQQHCTPEMSYCGSVMSHCAPVMSNCTPVEVPTEDMANYGYGQDIQALMMQHCAPTMSYCAPMAMQQWQPQVASYAAYLLSKQQLMHKQREWLIAACLWP